MNFINIIKQYLFIFHSFFPQLQVCCLCHFLWLEQLYHIPYRKHIFLSFGLSFIFQFSHTVPHTRGLPLEGLPSDVEEDSLAGIFHACRKTVSPHEDIFSDTMDCTVNSAAIATILPAGFLPALATAFFAAIWDAPAASLSVVLRRLNLYGRCLHSGV